MRSFLFSHLLPPNLVSDEFLGLCYQRAGNREDEVLWLVGGYMQYVTREAVDLGRRVTAEELRAFLHHGLLTHSTKRLRPLNIPGL